MKGMDLASALAAPVQGRGSGQGARSRSEAGDTDAESFDTVFNDVHGVAGAAQRQTDDAGEGSTVDSDPDTAQGGAYGSAAAQIPAAVQVPASVQIPAVPSGNDSPAFAGSAGHVAGGPADQSTPLTLAQCLSDGQAPSAAAATVAAAAGPDPRLTVPGVLLAATAQTSAVQPVAPGTAQTPGLQPATAVPVSGLGAGVPSAAPPDAGGVSGVDSTAPAFTRQWPAADPMLSGGAPSGGASGSAETGPLAAPATGARSVVEPGYAPAPNTAPATPAALSSTTPLSTPATAGGAAVLPSAALAEGISSGPVRAGTVPATDASVTASGDALAAAGTAAAAATPVSQPTSSTAAAPQPAAPAAPQPGATLQPQLAKPLFTLAGAPQGQHIMTLQVTPEDLGPMTVRAHIDAAGVRIELFAPGDAGREAIRGILPELRKELADAGFGASLDVSDHSGPGTTGRDGTSQDQNGKDTAARDSGSGTGSRHSPGDPRPGHRWEALADSDALRDARILNGPQTNLDILV